MKIHTIVMAKDIRIGGRLEGTVCADHDHQAKWSVTFDPVLRVFTVRKPDAPTVCVLAENVFWFRPFEEPAAEAKKGKAA